MSFCPPKAKFKRIDCWNDQGNGEPLPFGRRLKVKWRLRVNIIALYKCTGGRVNTREGKRTIKDKSGTKPNGYELIKLNKSSLEIRRRFLIIRAVKFWKSSLSKQWGQNNLSAVIQELSKFMKRCLQLQWDWIRYPKRSFPALNSYDAVHGAWENWEKRRKSLLNVISSQKEGLSKIITKEVRDAWSSYHEDRNRLLGFETCIILKLEVITFPLCYLYCLYTFHKSSIRLRGSI